MTKPSREYLYKAYVEDRTSIQNIAFDLATSPMAVKKWFAEYEIPIRQNNGGRRSTINKERVVKLRELGLTYKEIAETMNIKISTANSVMKEYRDEHSST